MAKLLLKLSDDAHYEDGDILVLSNSYITSWKADHETGDSTGDSTGECEE